MPDLSAYGDVEFAQEPHTQQVADADVRRGLHQPRPSPRSPSCPTGVTGDPTYQVADVVSATFTFSAEKAAQAAAAAGEVLPPPPAGIDGSRLRLQAGPGAAAVWSQPTGVPTLVVARAVAPTVDSSGVPFETVRDYLLSLPGLPDGLADQLREPLRGRRDAAPAGAGGAGDHLRRPTSTATRRPCSPPATGSSPASSGSRTA